MMKKIIISIIVIMMFAYVGSAWFFSSKILELGITECDVEHFVFCGDPSTQAIVFEDVSFETIDGFTIPAWFMPAENAKHAVLLVHGRTASRHEGMRYAKAIIDAGYSVLAIDLRHPRQDPAILSTMGYHEKKDVVAALDYLEKIKGFSSIGVMGFSMGASTSIIVMAEDQRIKVGVFSGGYANSMDVLSEQAKVIYGLPRYPLMPLVELFFEWRGNLDSKETDPENYIAQISPRPIYIMHGTADTTVDFSHGERLFSAAKEPKQFWQAEGGAHTRLWQLNKEKAESSVVEFFSRYL
ncbi:alpha/beta hydrolase [Cognaticolwellia mytili]|uniref:alpha/beta hydrolase n=1 Tax=Cognaticolwellia mytili TaxID=1888913 RepID=UPI000A16E0C4|nr:alpha/beta fold hydrolase [Cognaticolwellia mytili]